MKKDSKQRLFEVMGKLDPDFNVNEAVPDDATTDVQMAYNLKTDALKHAYEQIDHQQEFDDAFEAWFSGLGVADKYRHKININATLNHIRDVLQKYGVKN